MRDALTGLWSLIEWPRLLQEGSSEAVAHGREAWVALIDVDHFKRFNVHNGHLAGDQVLVELGQFLLSLESEESIQVARTGGQEFALVGLRDDGGHDARATCERILSWARDSLTPKQLEHCGDPHCIGPTRLTLSIALGKIDPGENPAALRERLATTMWEAKRAGRDRVESGLDRGRAGQ